MLTYTSEGKPDDSNNIGQQVEKYAPLVKKIAYRLIAKLPANVLVDDLIQNGMLGLLDALSRYQEMGAQFETYATRRIHGAMLDGLRSDDWMPRQLRREARKIEHSIAKLEQQLNRAPTEKEIAKDLGLSLNEYQHLLLEAKGQQLIYLEDLAYDDDDDYLEHHNSKLVNSNNNDSASNLNIINVENDVSQSLLDTRFDPAQILYDKDLKSSLIAALDNLPEREKLLMSLYYEQDLNLKEIGAVLDLTESRVCQIHSQAIARLRAAVNGEVKKVKERKKYTKKKKTDEKK